MKTAVLILLAFTFAHAEESVNVFVIMSVPAPAPPIVISSGAKNILFLGDSITVGSYVPADKTYPARIASKIQADGLDWGVVSSGVNGGTTAGGVADLPGLLIAQPKIVFIALGVNDLGPLTLDGTYKKTRRNLCDMIDMVRAAGAIPILAEFIGVGIRGDDLKLMFVEVALAKSIQFYPLFLSSAEDNLSDGVHPTEEGFRLMADSIYDFIRPLLN